MDQRTASVDQSESGFTRFPNYFLDKVMRKAGGVEWKVICAVVRETLGWNDQGRQRQEAEIPIERFEEMTGAKRSRLFEAITAACQSGAIRRPEQRSFRFRPVVKGNLHPVPKREKPAVDQGRLQFSQPETALETQSENRTLDHEQNPIIGLTQSENRTLGESVLICIKEKDPKKVDLVPPYQSKEFLSTLADYAQHRKEIRKPLRPTGTKKLYEKLALMGERAAIENLNRSIECGWVGVFGQAEQDSGEVRTEQQPQQTIRERLRTGTLE